MFLDFEHFTLVMQLYKPNPGEAYENVACLKFNELGGDNEMFSRLSNHSLAMWLSVALSKSPN